MFAAAAYLFIAYATGDTTISAADTQKSYTPPIEEPVVIHVGQCSNNFKDWWHGGRDGQCEVTLSDGTTVHVSRPVEVGDHKHFLKIMKHGY